MRLTRPHVIAMTIGILVLGASTPPIALASSGSGLTVDTRVTANLNQAVHADADRIKLRTKAPTLVRVQNIVFAAGARTGWHHHPGIVVVAVQSGVVTVMDADCNTTNYGAGQPAGAVFVESGHEIIEVTSAGGASVYATYIVPAVEPAAFRVEADIPSCVSEGTDD